MTRIRAALLGLAFCTSAGFASADPLDKDADAERLFREGQKLMEERRYGEACPKFDLAYRKDQQLGTLLNLAYCHKELGTTWLAWVEFKEAELKAIELKRTERRDFARQRMAELEKSLARVVIEPTTKVELTEVLVEDRHVPEAEKSTPFAAEIGTRKVTFRAKGKKQAVQLVTITKGSAPQKIAVPEMEDQPPEPPPPPRMVIEKPSPPPPVRGRDGGTQRALGLALGGVGLVGIGVGSVFGLRTLGNNPCTDGLPAGTSNEPSCTQEERDAVSNDGAIATAAFVAGGSIFAVGALIFFTAPHRRSAASVQPRLGLGSVGVGGRF
jgi:hypothetical protein